jgi:peptidoglycan/xylan/chitin deacetylase (PgdA/CDA1 family)
VTSLKAAARRVGLRREHLRSARVLVERRGLGRWRRRRPAVAGRILCYHGVGTPSWGYNDVTPARFRRHLELALEQGYRFVPAETIARTGGEPGELAVTFDDGLRSVGENAAPILAELGVPWTLFVVSGWASGDRWRDPGLFLGWSELVELARAGATLGSHSVSHPNFGRLELEAARAELVESRRAIEAGTGLAIDTFAIPFGQSGDWSEACSEVAREAGYRVVYAQAIETRRPGTVPRSFITGYDDDAVFLAALEGAFDRWEEWV